MTLHKNLVAPWSDFDQWNQAKRPFDDRDDVLICIGDPVIVERFERGDFVNVLTNRADQMLAWFAQPGRLMCPRGVDPRRMSSEFADASIVMREHSAECSREMEGDSREVRELRQIVNGMREELKEYLANGNGTPRSYWRRLLQRTQQEMQIYERTRRELENEKNAAFPILFLI